MKFLCSCGLILLHASAVLGCAKDISGQAIFDPHTALAKRQETQFPPVLDKNEAILVNSFDNASLEDWNYYYAHSYHLAGTNESLAQWTADRWTEFGWTSGLTTYCLLLTMPVMYFT